LASPPAPLRLILGACFLRSLLMVSICARVLVVCGSQHWAPLIP
jgi:hypothetical protein